MPNSQTMTEIANKYPNVLQMLRSIPKDLRRIFVPMGMTFRDLELLNINISKHKAVDRERNIVMSVQRASGFPLRPNISLREAVIKAKIQALKKDLNSPPNEKGYEQNQDGDSIL